MLNNILLYTDICRDFGYSNLRVKVWEKEKWPTAVPDVTTTSCHAVEAAEAGNVWIFIICTCKGFLRGSKTFYYSGGSSVVKPNWLSP